MKTEFVLSYQIFKRAAQSLPVYWIASGQGVYSLFAGSDGRIFTCSIEGADAADFEGWKKVPANEATSADDAYALALDLFAGPPKMPDGTPFSAIAQRQSDNIPQVAIAPTVGSETIQATHNFCDPCSWFGDSVRVVGEALTDSGDHYTFNSANPYWIDMVSGRIHDDDALVDDQKARNPQNPHGYRVIVKVDGVEAVMREPFEASGGDYEVIWETGQVHFFSSQVGKTVTADYSYANGSTFYLRPTPGKILRILDAEADLSIGAVMTDSITYSVWGVSDYFAPQAGLPSGTMIELAGLTYKRMQQIVAEAKGSYPLVEPVGASLSDMALPIAQFRRKSRGLMSKISALPFKYSTTRDLSSASMMEVRVKTAHDRPFDGDSVTITFYCVSKDETP